MDELTSMYLCTEYWKMFTECNTNWFPHTGFPNINEIPMKLSHSKISDALGGKECSFRILQLPTFGTIILL